VVTDWWQASKKWASWLEGQATLPDKRSRMKLVGALGLAAVMLIGLVAIGNVVAPSSATHHHSAGAAQLPLFTPTAPSPTVPNTTAVPSPAVVPKTAAVPSPAVVPKTVATPNTGGTTTATPAAARGTLTASRRGHSHGKARRGHRRGRRKAAGHNRVRS